MISRPWYKRYPADFIDGTMGMSLEEKGAYSLCLDLIYARGGPVPDDARWLAGTCGVSLRKWKVLRAGLIARGKLFAAGGKLSNRRADAEIRQLDADLAAARRTGALGGKKRAETARKQARNLSETAPKPKEKTAENRGDDNLFKGLGEGTLNHKEKNREEKTDSSLRSDMPPPLPAAGDIAIPTNRFETAGEVVVISAGQIAEFEKTYPAVDVRQSLRRARQWAIANPRRRKTHRGVAAFVNNWLAREQDRGCGNDRTATFRPSYGGGDENPARAAARTVIAEMCGGEKTEFPL